MLSSFFSGRVVRRIVFIAEMRPIDTDIAGSVVSVLGTRVRWATTVELQVRMRRSGIEEHTERNEPCRGSTSPTRKSVLRGGDAVFYQITLTTRYQWHYTYDICI